MQGWAIVDNTLGEDWKNVRLSLVSGAPQSFVQNLSTPYYVRRPVVPLPHSVLLTPQTHEGALMPMAKKAAGLGAGFAGAMLRAPAVRGGSPGGMAGGVLGSIIGGVTGSPPPPAAMEPQAKGRAVGELFEYNIKSRVTIGRNQSALVPILQAKLDAEKVTLWKAGDLVPLRALWLANNSRLALDAGTFDVMDDGAFAGEGLFNTIRPGEKRLISYAADPAVQVSTRESSAPQQITRIHVARGLMMTVREMRQKEIYRISDSDSKPRTVIIEDAIRPGWKLAKGLKPNETTKSVYRFKVSVKPKESTTLAVEETRPEFSQIVLSKLTSNQVAVLARQRRLTPQMQAAFQKILARKNALAEIDREIRSRRQDVAGIATEQDRIRENMKALKGGAEEKQLLERYVRELNAQETRLATLHAQLASLKTKRAQAAADLDHTIGGIELDETF